jgi:hypothetical protein
MNHRRDVKQFDGFRETNWRSITLQFPIIISMIMGNFSTAIAKSPDVTAERASQIFAEEINRSANLNRSFNTNFQAELNEATGNFNKNASNYLLSLPTLKQEASAVSGSCSEGIAPLYCALQKSFLNIKPQDLTEASITNIMTPAVTRTASNEGDTMIVVIPGIFGEFINQTAFGEVFGEADAPQNFETSNFSKAFNVGAEACKTNQAPYCRDSRFLLARWTPTFDDRPAIDFENKKQVVDENIDEWIKVASVDTPDHQRTKFKVVVLKLKAMSMESLGNQDVLADLYLRRFDKFMAFHKNVMNQDTPKHIIFIGYSRGAPIGYEMLAKLNAGNTTAQKYAHSDWSKNVSAMVSVGGVIFGSALADTSIVGEASRDWKKTPVKAKLTQAFRLLTQKFIPFPSEDDVFQAHVKNGKLARTITTNIHTLNRLKIKIAAYQRELKQEIAAINNGDLTLSEASDSAKVAIVVQQVQSAHKALNALAIINNDQATMTEKMDGITTLKTFAQAINWSGVKSNVNDLVGKIQTASGESSPDLQSTITSLSLLIGNYARLQDDSRAIAFLSSLNTSLSKTMAGVQNLSTSDSQDLESTIQRAFVDLIAIAKQFKPEELLIDLKGASLGTSDPSAVLQAILSKLPPGVQNAAKALAESIPDSQSVMALNAQLLKNWGAEESVLRVKAACNATPSLSQKGPEVCFSQTLALLKEFNLNLAKFFFYFNRAWEGASELGTPARMQWWKNRGHLLPTNLKYFTFGGILDQPDQPFHSKGIDFGWRANTADDKFLVLNHSDLSKVGQTDGLPLEFAGSRINDSQVDIYKTHLWPSIGAQLTGGSCFDSRFIGLARTHHWGLTLPYAFVNKSKDSQRPIPNPFPREVLLRTLVDTIVEDLATSLSICSDSDSDSTSTSPAAAN